MNMMLSLRINTFFHALHPLVYSIFFILYSVNFTSLFQENNDQALSVAV